MNMKNTMNYLTKFTLSAIIIGLISSSCKKEEEVPLNKQFQYDLGTPEFVTALPTNDYTMPSISLSDFDADNNLDLIVSSQNTGKIHIAYAKEDGTFNDFSDTYQVADGFQITDVASEKDGNIIKNFIVLASNSKVYYQTTSASNNPNTNLSEIATAPKSTANNGMLGSDFFDSDSNIDLLLAKQDDDKDLRLVYLYAGTDMGDYIYDSKPICLLPQDTKSFDITDNVLFVLDANDKVYSYDLIKHTEPYDD